MGHPFIQPANSPPSKNRLGLWLGYRKLYGKPYLPSRADRSRIEPNAHNYQAVINWSLGPQETDSFFTVTPGYLGVFAFLGNSQQPEGVQVSVFDPTRNRQLTESPMHFDNFSGTAQTPFYYASAGGSLKGKGGIYIFEPNTQILAKIANLSNFANSGQIVAVGRVLTAKPDASDLAPVSEAANLVTQVQEPSWIKMPTSGESFNPAQYVTIPAIGATATIVTHTVGTGRNSVMNRFGNEVVGGDWINGSGALIWQILKNGVPVKNQEKIVSSLGAVAAPSPIGPFRFVENDVILVTVTNVSVAAAGQLIGARMDGWDYPKNLDLAFLW